MINFIVNSDDNLKDSIINCIDSVMTNNNLNYNTHFFNDSSLLLEQDFQNNKIYIIDIDINENGLDIAKKIREKNFMSYIIILTNYDNYSELYRSMIMPINIINKFINFHVRLKDTLAFLIKNISEESQLIIKYNGIVHNININDILYITRDSLSRKTIIITYNNEIQCNIPLSEFKNKNFIQTHRSCIVNIENIESVDFVENIITFKNNKKIDLLSRRNYKNLKDKFINNKN